MIYRHRGELVRARQQLNDALAIHVETGDRLGEASVLGDLGSVAAELGQREETCRLLREADAMYEQTGAGGEGPEDVRTNLKELGCE